MAQCAACKAEIPVYERRCQSCGAGVVRDANSLLANAPTEKELSQARFGHLLALPGMLILGVLFYAALGMFGLLARIHRRTPMDGVRTGEGGVRELQGGRPGLHWGRWEVSGRSSAAAQGPYGRLRELGCAGGWRENTQQGTLADRDDASLRGRWVNCRLAVRLGVEWLAAGPRRD